MCLYEFTEHPLTEKWKFISRKNCPLNIGNGKEEYHTQLGTSFWNLYHTSWNLLREFDKACYPELCKKSFNEKICNWAIMAATNERVDQINQNKGGLEIGQLLSLFKIRQSSRPSTNIHIANGIFEFLDSIWFALSTFCSWKDISL